MSSYIEVGEESDVAGGDTLAPLETPYAMSSRERYGGACLTLTNFTLLIFGILGAGDCPISPSVPAYLIVFSLSQISAGCLNFYYKIPLSAGHKRKNHRPTQVSSALSAMAIPLAIWGAAVSFPWIHDLTSGEACPSSTGVGAVVSASIVIAIVALMILFASFNAVRARLDTRRL